MPRSSRASPPALSWWSHSLIDEDVDQTFRKREVLEPKAEGLTDCGMAVRLSIAVNTVETHVRRIIMKLDLPATPTDNRRVVPTAGTPVA